MPLTVFADGALFGARHGAGPPAVLALHGWGRTHGDFDRSLTGLDAIALDLPGFGASPEPSTAGGAGLYADLVEPVLDEFDGDLVVVGHSFGGRVAAHLAQRHQRVAGVVMTGAPLLHRAHRSGKPALRYRLGRALHRWHLLGDRQLEGLKDKYGSADYRAAQGIMRDVLVTTVNEEYRTQLESISQPVELVWGEHDDAAPVEIAERAAQILADAALDIVSGTGHMLPLDNPDPLRAAIDRRLAALTSTPTPTPTSRSARSEEAPGE